MCLSKEALELKKEVELYSQLLDPCKKVLQAKRIETKFGVDQQKLNELEAYSLLENDPEARLYPIQEIADKVIIEMEDKAGLPKGWLKERAAKSKGKEAKAKTP
jgi:AmiR/NasT family two-component response regulator